LVSQNLLRLIAIRTRGFSKIWCLCILHMTLRLLTAIQYFAGKHLYLQISLLLALCACCPPGWLPRMAMAPGSTRDSCGTPSNSPAAHSAPLVVTHSSSCTLLRPRQRRAGRGPPDGHTAQMLYQRQSVSDSAAAIIRAAEWIPSPVSSISVDEPESFSVRIYPKSKPIIFTISLQRFNYLIIVAYSLHSVLIDIFICHNDQEYHVCLSI